MRPLVLALLLVGCLVQQPVTAPMTLVVPPPEPHATQEVMPEPATLHTWQVWIWGMHAWGLQEKYEVNEEHPVYIEIEGYSIRVSVLNNKLHMEFSNESSVIINRCSASGDTIEVLSGMGLSVVCKSPDQ
jgi:hypothetical protein